MDKYRAFAVVGATASGKSGLALALAPRLNAEIICMDSMQVYRRMDIGTAKPTATEQTMVRHHMLDVVEPTESFAVADYASRALDIIAKVSARGHVPMLVGGTGLYLRALTRGLSLGGAGSDPALRDKLHALAEEPDGLRRLHERLAKVDPASAARLHPNDARRVIRALEVYELTGQPISCQNTNESGGAVDVLTIGLRCPREALYQRVEKRVARMLRDGLLDEVSALLQSGVPPEAQAMQGIGYKEFVPVVRGDMALLDAAWQTVLNTRHYAKRQGTWFRAEPAIRWLDALAPTLEDDAYAYASTFFNDKAKKAGDYETAY